MTHRFWVPKQFLWLSNPKVWLCVGHQYSRFLSSLTYFVDYYSPFWGPKAISMVVEPEGVLTCWSSRLAVWANSSPFHGLLLSFMDYYLLIRGPWAISMIDEPRGAFMYRSSIILGLSDSGLFQGLLLTVLGSQSDFHSCRTPKVCLRVGHQDSQFGCVYVLVINTHNFGRF